MRAVWLFVVVAATALPARAADPPRPKLHILLAIDTGSDLRDSVKIDQANMARVFTANIPADRRTLKVIDGTSLTTANIVAHYRTLKVDPADTILFFYAGHGAKDPEKGLAFVPQQGKTVVYRSDVREAMKKTGANLVVLLSDCCSTKSKLPGKPFYGATRPVTPVSGTGIHPTLDHLFFNHKGVVDITAAVDGEASWSDLKDGGIFTRTLTKTLLRPVADLDTDGDKLVSWKEFYGVLKKQAEGTYVSWAKTMRARGETIDQPNQHPNALSLGELSGGVPPKPDPAVRTYAVICLLNESGEDVKFKYRFTGQNDWTPVTLIPGKRGEYSAPQGKSPNLPRFEILFDGNKSTIELEADAWSGTDAPPRGAAGREFPIILRKKDK